MVQLRFYRTNSCGKCIRRNLYDFSCVTLSDGQCLVLYNLHHPIQYRQQIYSKAISTNYWHNSILKLSTKEAILPSPHRQIIMLSREICNNNILALSNRPNREYAFCDHANVDITAIVVFFEKVKVPLSLHGICTR